MNVYGPCRLNHNGIEIEEITEYPFRNKVDFVIRCDRQFDIYLRIPEWCSEYQISVNGEKTSAEKNADGFAKVSGNWKNGDTISIVFAEEIKVIRVDDSDGAAKFPIAIKRGALLYSLHIKEIWNEYPGNPITPLPDGWSWFEALPYYEESDCPDPRERLGLNRNQLSWNVALSENLNPDDISVEFVETDGYVWENPKIKLHLKGYKAPYLCAPYPTKTFEPFGAKQTVTHEVELTLVPYGCTNLRITYFPIADI